MPGRRRLRRIQSLDPEPENNYEERNSQRRYGRSGRSRRVEVIDEKVVPNAQLVLDGDLSPDDEDIQESLSQERGFDDQNFNDCVGTVMNTILLYNSTKTPIQQKVISKAMNQGSQSKLTASKVIKIANSRFKKFFGYKLQKLQKDVYAQEAKKAPRKKRKRKAGTSTDKATDFYILKNASKNEASHAMLNRQSSKDLQTLGLLMVIYGFILLQTKGEIFESTLWNELSRLNIEKRKKHAVFGDVDKLIEKTFVKQKYLARVKVQMDGEGFTQSDKYQFAFKIGMRGHAETSFPKIFRFMYEVLGKEIDEAQLECFEKQVEQRQSDVKAVQESQLT